MEHLALPRDSIKPRPKILLATAQFQDGGPFLSYSERHQNLLSGTHPHVPTQADALAGRLTAGVSDGDILNYYQGWLFFSLLAEFLGPLFRARKYMNVVMADDGNEIESISLSTGCLHEDLAAWREKGPLGRIHSGDEYHKHLDKCLDTALGGFNYLDTFPGFVGKYPDEMICLASLAETLDIAVMTALDGLQSPWVYSRPRRSWIQQVYSLLNFKGAECRARMLAAGWCPGDMARVDDSFTTIAAYYYFGNFKPDVAHPDLHKDCPSYGCTLSTLAEPRHMTEDCKCPGMVELSEQDLIDIYNKDCIPCFSIGRLEDGGLGIGLSSISMDSDAQNDPENRYVALSHVWSEGLGNPGANKLPLCQLAYIQHEAMRAQQAVESREEDEPNLDGTGITISEATRTQSVNLWIDTMCCPATPGLGKNLCLAKMREIYSNAYAVLVRTTVLDSLDLEPIVTDPTGGVMDVAAKLYLSPWMRRMWTLQEGVLAGLRKSPRGTGERLILDFNGGLLSLESVVGLLKQAPPHEAALAFDMIGKLGELAPTLYGLDGQDGGAMFTFLHILTSALKFRGVSVQSDELVCLATLLGLRVDKSRSAVPLIGDGQTPEEGMCELWKRIEKLNMGIPSDIIFSTIPRLSVRGFQWAPRTIIQHGKYGQLYSSSSSPELAVITDSGLRVRFPGVMLKMLDHSEFYGRDLLQRLRANDADADPGDDQELKVFSQILLVQIPTGGTKWYAVRLHQTSDDEDADSEPEMRDFGFHQRLRTGRLALMLKQPEPAGQGLLVTVADEKTAVSDPSVIQVHTEYPVIINGLQASASFVAASAHQCLTQLHSAAGASSGTDDDLIGELLPRIATKMLNESKELEDAMYAEVLSRKSSATEEEILAKFIMYVNAHARCGGAEGTPTPRGQFWCVD